MKELQTGVILQGLVLSFFFLCTWHIWYTWPINLLVNEKVVLYLVLWKWSKTTGSTFHLGGDSLPFTHSCIACDPSIATYFGRSQNLQPSTVTLIAKPVLLTTQVSIFLTYSLSHFIFSLASQPSKISGHPLGWVDPNTRGSDGCLHSCISAEMSRSRYPIIQGT